MRNQTLKNAAYLLRREAKSLRESCKVGSRNWQCGDCTLANCQKFGYIELIDAAKALDAVVRAFTK